MGRQSAVTKLIYVQDEEGYTIVIEQLTPGEDAVLQLMDEGLNARDISERLGTTYTSVRSHQSNINSKLYACSAGDAVEKARGYGLLSKYRNLEQA